MEFLIQDSVVWLTIRYTYATIKLLVDSPLNRSTTVTISSSYWTFPEDDTVVRDYFYPIVELSVVKVFVTTSSF